MNRSIFWRIRGFLAILWFLIGSILGTFLALARWGNLDLDCWIARLMAWGCLPCAGIDVEAFGLENLESRRPCVYVSNHQGGLDIAVFGKNFPHKTVAIGKKELVWIPFFGIVFLASGNILINRQNRREARSSIQQAIDRIQRDQVRVWIMAEGTRNRAGEGLLPFKKGAFHMAIGAKVPIVPIIASPYKEVGSMEQCSLRPAHVQVRVLPPIETDNVKIEDADRLCDEVREKMLAALAELRTTIRN